MTTVPTDWTIVFATPQGILTERTVTASYFKEEGELIVFKDDGNRAVYAARASSLVSIERNSVADPIMTAFKQALEQANGPEGRATVGFRNGTTNETGHSVETGYDITVVRYDTARTALAGNATIADA